MFNTPFYAKEDFFYGLPMRLPGCKGSCGTLSKSYRLNWLCIPAKPILQEPLAHVWGDLVLFTSNNDEACGTKITKLTAVAGS
jgi:hypothetical protein